MPRGALVVAGAVEVSGRVIHQEHGVRAQYAKPIALCPIYAIDGVATAQYGGRHQYMMSVRFAADITNVPLFPNMQALTSEFPMEDLHAAQRQLEEDQRRLNEDRQRVMSYSTLMTTSTTNVMGITTASQYSIMPIISIPKSYLFNNPGA